MAMNNGHHEQKQPGKQPNKFMALLRTYGAGTVAAVTAIIGAVIGALTGNQALEIERIYAVILTVVIFNLLFVGLNYFIVIKKSIDESKDGNCPYVPRNSAISSFPSRDGLAMPDKFEQANERIYVLTTDLHYLSGSLNSLNPSGNKEVDIKILAMKPDSNFAQIIHREVNVADRTDFVRNLKGYLGLIVDKSREINKERESKSISAKFEIKAHHFMPSFVLYIIDSELFFNPIIPFHRGRDCIHTRYDLGDDSARKEARDFLKAFRILWELSHGISDEDILFEKEDIKNELQISFEESWDNISAQIEKWNEIETDQLLNFNEDS